MRNLAPIILHISIFEISLHIFLPASCHWYHTSVPSQSVESTPLHCVWIPTTHPDLSSCVDALDTQDSKPRTGTPAQTWTPSSLYLSSKPYIGLILMPSTTSSWILFSCHSQFGTFPPPYSAHATTPLLLHTDSLLTLVQVTSLLDKFPPNPILMPYTRPLAQH